MHSSRIAVATALLLGACAVSSSSPAEEQENPSNAGKNPFGNSDMRSGPDFGNTMNQGLRPALCNGGCQDFPFEPLIDTSGPTPVPANAAQLFGSGNDFTGPGPCVIEPHLGSGNQRGALFPRNWL